MNRKNLIAVAAVAAVAATFLSCSVLSSAIGSVDPLAGVKASAEKRANAEIASGIGLTGMTRKMMFNVLYAQVFFIGGFNPDIYDLAETQGCVWRLESRSKDDEKPSVVQSERAFLRKNADGSSWWYLSWKSEEEEWAFEALMDADMMAKKIRYYNADVKRVEEAVFEEKQAAAKGAKGAKAEDKAPPPESPTSDMTAKDLPRHSKGKEKVTVGSGSYQADKIVWEWTNSENGEKASYTWWVDAKAPGGLVKFLWADADDSLKGELVSVKKGYTTKFGSF